MTVADTPPAFARQDGQVEFREVVSDFLIARSPEPEVRALMATERGFDPAVWRQMASQLGLQGVLIPAEYGGQGLSEIELAIVQEEMGRVLLCAPFLATAVLAVSALIASGDRAAMADYLPGIASGQTVATLAFGEDTGLQGSVGASRLTAEPVPGGGHLITGDRRFVLDGASADVILLVAATADGAGLFAVSGSADGLTATSLPAMDQTRKLADLALRSVPGRLIGPAGAAPAVLDRALARGPDRAGGRAGRRGAGGPGQRRAVRADQGSVRRPDRQFPGHQAPVRRCAGRRGVRPVGGLSRRLGRGS